MVTHMDTHQVAANDAAVHSTDDIVVRAVTFSDLIDSLKLGLEDFKAKPSHIFVLGLLYPIGVALTAGYALGRDVLPLAFPVAAGLALLGPFAAIVLYEISRRRELGQSFSWGDIGDVFERASNWSIGVIMIALVAVFGVWLVVAQAIFDATLGVGGYIEPMAFIGQVLTTREGWTLIVLGNAVGFIFAAGVLATNVVSFPMLLDRDVGAPAAVATSLRVAAKSPLTIALWGLIIAGSMAAGAAVFLVGLGVVVPVLGHATWHLYRKAVAP
jgi:uncharacterized membrane protein